MAGSKFLKIYLLIDAISMLVLTILWVYEYYIGADAQIYYRISFLLIGYIRVGYFFLKYKRMIKNEAQAIAITK